MMRMRVRSWRGLTALVLGGLGGCTPEVEPSWLVLEPRELALAVRVLDRPGDEGVPRSFSRVLPGDMVEFAPFVAGARGPLGPQQLDVATFVCGNRAVPCITDAAREPAECTFSFPALPAETCSLGRSTRVSLPELDLGIPVDDPRSYFGGLVVQLVVSTPEGPGVDGCLRRLSQRESLDGCLFFSDHVYMAAAELAERLEREGVELGDRSELFGVEPRPRNRNPAVESFAVTLGESQREVASGDRLQVAEGDTLRVSWNPDEALDIEMWEGVDPQGETRIVSEFPQASWYVTRASEAFWVDGWEVSWTAQGDPGPVFLYLVVEDQWAGTDWGWLEIDVQESR